MSTNNVFESKLFPELYATTQGQSIWTYLNEFESVIRMQAVSDVGKPALLAIEGRLISDFGIIEREQKDFATDDLKSKNDSLKRMIGSMVRQVMERNGYKLENTSIRVTTSKVFFSAALYKKSEVQ